jgi:hypothetical protein
MAFAALRLAGRIGISLRLSSLLRRCKPRVPPGSLAVANTSTVAGAQPAAAAFAAEKSELVADATGLYNTLHEFMHCIDSGDSERFAHLFVSDAVLTIRKTGAIVRGRPALAALCTTLHGLVPLGMHLEFNPVVRLLPLLPEEHQHQHQHQHQQRNARDDSEGGRVLQRVANRSYWQAVRGDAVVSCGVHEDVLVLQRRVAAGEPRWQFETRLVLHHFAAASGFTNNGEGCLSDGVSVVGGGRSGGGAR